MVPMTDGPFVNLSSLIDDGKCFDLIRQHRWPDGVRCPTCGSTAVARHGRDDTQPNRQRYRCKGSVSFRGKLRSRRTDDHQKLYQAAEIRSRSAATRCTWMVRRRASETFWLM